MNHKFVVRSILTISMFFFLGLGFFLSAQDVKVEEETPASGEQNKPQAPLVEEKKSDEGKKKEFDLGKVVVTGTGKKTYYKDSPVPTRTIDRKRIEKTSSGNIYEIVEGQNGVLPGVECQNCNFSELRINGLGSKYNQMLVNGLPLIGSLSSVYILQQFPEILIEDVEIVKGGGSALYGGGAVGGVMDIHLRKPDKNQSEIKLTQSMIEGKTPTTDVSFAQSHVSDNMGLTGFGNLHYQNAHDVNGDGFSDIGIMKGGSLGFNGYIQPTMDTELTYMGTSIQEERRGGNALNDEPHNAGITEGMNTLINMGALSWNQRVMAGFDYDIYAAFSSTERKSYFGGNRGWDETPLETSDDTNDTGIEAYGRTKAVDYTSGTNLRYDGGIWRALLGYQVQYNELIDRATGRTTKSYAKETITDHGVITQAEWIPVKAFTMLAGVRTDVNSQIDDPIVSPRVNLLYHITKELDIRGMYSSGFAAPRTYVEDLHLGVYEGLPRTTKNDKGLKPEKSQTYGGNLVMDAKRGKVSYGFELGGYYTDLKDAFELTPYDDEDADTDPDYNLRKNSSGASSLASDVSVNFGYDFNATHSLEVEAGVNYIKAEYEKAVVYDETIDLKDKRFLKTPEVSGNLLLIYSLARWTFTSDVVWTGPMLILNETEGKLKTTDSFFDVGLQIAYAFYVKDNTKWEVFGGIKNIADSYQNDLMKGYDRDPAYIYGPSLPRTYYLGLKGTL